METTLPIPTDAEMYLGACPMRTVLGRVADKWTVLIVGLLAGAPVMRFNELKRSIGGISQKMLTQTLRDLERDGLVERKVYAEVPPRVEYALTDVGRTLCGPIGELARWANDHIAEVYAAQKAFDERNASNT
ncbi:MAG TPA: helix-turn-helix domain-containing protein [Candidatus Baltobacteraceae bacterium]|nr:helix-turn-helix domain-containing protein [Candidatus Baltobacteraceae bacterium]